MKSILSFFVLLVPLIILGCSQGGNPYDNNKLREELKKEGITPKLPTKFPITIVDYERYNPPHKSYNHEVIFKGEDGEQITLTINDSENVEYSNLEKVDEEIINGNSGFYIEGPGPSLHWTEDDYHYILQYYTEEKDTKEIMIEIAESFR